MVYMVVFTLCVCIWLNVYIIDVRYIGYVELMTAIHRNFKTITNNLNGYTTICKLRYKLYSTLVLGQDKFYPYLFCDRNRFSFFTPFNSDCHYFSFSTVATAGV